MAGGADFEAVVNMRLVDNVIPQARKTLNQLKQEILRKTREIQQATRVSQSGGLLGASGARPQDIAKAREIVKRNLRDVEQAERETARRRRNIAARLQFQIIAQQERATRKAINDRRRLADAIVRIARDQSEKEQRIARIAAGSSQFRRIAAFERAALAARRDPGAGSTSRLLFGNLAGRLPGAAISRIGIAGVGTGGIIALDRIASRLAGTIADLASLIRQRVFQPLARELGTTLRVTSQVEQQLGRVRSVFGASAPDIQRFADSLANTIKQASRFEVLDVAAQFQAFFVGLGAGQQQALNLSERLTALAFDFKAFDDTITDTQEIVDRLFATLAGEARAARRLRVGLDIRDIALSKELERTLGVSSRQATELQRVLARVGLTEIASGRAGVTGQALREARTLFSLVRALQARVLDLRVAFGGALADAAKNVLDQINTIGISLKSFFERNQQLLQSFTKIASILGLIVLKTEVWSRIIQRFGPLLTELGLGVFRNLTDALDETKLRTFFDSLEQRFDRLVEKAQLVATAVQDALAVGAQQVPAALQAARLPDLRRSEQEALSDVAALTRRGDDRGRVAAQGRLAFIRRQIADIEGGLRTNRLIRQGREQLNALGQRAQPALSALQTFAARFRQPTLPSSGEAQFGRVAIAAGQLAGTLSGLGTVVTGLTAVFKSAENEQRRAALFQRAAGRVQSLLAPLKETLAPVIEEAQKTAEKATQQRRLSLFNRVSGALVGLATQGPIGALGGLPITPITTDPRSEKFIDELTQRGLAERLRPSPGITGRGLFSAELAGRAFLGPQKSMQKTLEQILREMQEEIEIQQQIRDAANRLVDREPGGVFD